MKRYELLGGPVTADPGRGLRGRTTPGPIPSYRAGGFRHRARAAERPRAVDLNSDEDGQRMSLDVPQTVTDIRRGP